MSELLNDLGAVGIGVELDLSGLEGQLRELEQFQLPALKLKVQIDPKSLQAQLQSLKLEPIAVDIKVNAGNSEAALDRLTDKCAKAQQQLQSLAEELRSLSGAQVNFNVKTYVDRTQLETATRDLKRDRTQTVRFHAQVQPFNLLGLQPRLTAQVQLVARSDTSRLSESIAHTFGRDLERALGKVFQGDLLGGVSTLIVAPVKAVGRVVLGTVQGVVSGVVLGVTKEILQGVTQGLVGLNQQPKTVKVKAEVQTSKLSEIQPFKLPEIHHKLTAQVDDRQLTALNKHLDLKKRHFQEVNSYFRSNPLTPDTDLRPLESLATWGRRKQFQIPVTVRYATADASAVPQPPTPQQKGSVSTDTEKLNQSITSLSQDLEKSIAKLGKANLFSNWLKLGMAPLRVAGNLFLGTGQMIASGLVLGVTQEITRGTGKGLSTALEKALSQRFGSSELMAEKLGSALGTSLAAGFQSTTHDLVQQLEKQMAKIQDQGLRQSLQKIVTVLKAAPEAVQAEILHTIGQDNATREGLFQRGRYQQQQAAKKPVAREQAARERRDTVNAMRVAESEIATARIPTQIDRAQRTVSRVQKAGSRTRQIVQRQFGLDLPAFLEKSSQYTGDIGRLEFEQEFNRTETLNNQVALKQEKQGIGKLKGLLARAEASGNIDSAEEIRQAIQDARIRIDVLKQSLNHLLKNYQTTEEKLVLLQNKLSQEFAGQPAETILKTAKTLDRIQSRFLSSSQAVQDLEAQKTELADTYQARIQAAQAAKNAFGLVSPINHPKAYRELAQKILRDRYDEDKLPQLIVSDEFLRQSSKEGAETGATYNPIRNAIVISSGIAEALENNTLSSRQTDIVGEEIAHAKDMDFGSYQGQVAFQRNEIVGKRVVPTLEELSQLAPNLALYRPEVRQVELNAKVQALRAAPDYLQDQVEIRNYNAAVELSIAKRETAPNVHQAASAVVALKKEGDRLGWDVATAIETYSGLVQDAVEGITQVAAEATARAGSATSAELAALQQRLQTAIHQLDLVYQAATKKAGSLEDMARQAAEAQREHTIGLLDQFSRKKTLIPLARELGIENPEKLGKRALIRQLEQVDILQLQPKVFELTRLQAEKQRIRQERIAAAQELAARAAETAGGVLGSTVQGSKSVFRFLQQAANSPTGQKVQQFTQSVGQGLSAAGVTALHIGARRGAQALRSGYQGLQAIEEGVFDTFTFGAGRPVKRFLQSTALPALGWGLLAHQLPSAAALGELAQNGFTHALMLPAHALIEQAGGQMGAIVQQSLQTVPLVGAKLAPAINNAAYHIATLVVDKTAQFMAVLLTPTLLGRMTARSGAAVLKRGVIQPVAHALQLGAAPESPALPAGQETSATPTAAVEVADLPDRESYSNPQLLAAIRRLGGAGVSSKSDKQKLLSVLRAMRNQPLVDDTLVQIAQEIDTAGRPIRGFNAKTEKALIKQVAKTEKRLNRKLRKLKTAGEKQRQQLLGELTVEMEQVMDEIDRLKGLGTLSGPTVKLLSATQGRLRHTTNVHPQLLAAQQERITIARQADQQARVRRSNRGLARVEGSLGGFDFSSLNGSSSGPSEAQRSMEAAMEAAMKALQQEMGKAQETYATIARTVAQMSGIMLEQSKIPQLIESPPEHSAVDAAYYFDTNKVAISPRTQKLLSSGLPTLLAPENREELGVLAHETWHAVQGNFGEIGFEDAVLGKKQPRISPNLNAELAAIPPHLVLPASNAIENSIAFALKQIQALVSPEMFQQLEPIARQNLKRLESDAYAFQINHTNRLADHLLQQSAPQPRSVSVAVEDELAQLRAAVNPSPSPRQPASYPAAIDDELEQMRVAMGQKPKAQPHPQPSVQASTGVGSLDDELEQLRAAIGQPPKQTPNHTPRTNAEIGQPPKQTPNHTPRTNPAQDASVEDELQAMKRALGLGRVDRVNQGFLQKLAAQFRSLFSLNRDRATQIQANFESIFQEIAALSGVALDPKQIPTLAIDDDRLRHLGAQAFYEIEQNLILIGKELEEILARSPRALKRYREQLRPLIHEGRHSVQLEGGQLSIEAAVQGKKVQLLDDETLSAQQKQSVEGSVEVARQQGAHPQELESIRVLETDAYAFEGSTKRILKGVAWKNATGLDKLLNHLEENLEQVREQVARSLVDVTELTTLFLNRVRRGTGVVQRRVVGLGDQAITQTLNSLDRGPGVESRREARSLGLFNRATERQRQDQTDQINQVFESENLKYNRQLRATAARIARRAENQPSISYEEINRRTGAEAARAHYFSNRIVEGYGVSPEREPIEDLTRALQKPKGLQALFSKLSQTLKNLDEIDLDAMERFRQRFKVFLVEAKTLQNDLETARVAAHASGDRESERQLAQISNRLGSSISGAETLLSLPRVQFGTDQLDQIQRFKGEIKSVYTLLERQPPKDPGGFFQLGKTLLGLGGIAKLAIGAFGGFFLFQQITGFLKQLGGEAVDAAIKLGNLRTALDFASGGPVQGAKNLAFIRSEVERLRIPLASAREGFVKLAASTRSTRSEGSTRGLFTGVASMATVLGLSPEETNGSLLAFTQMASKGKVYSEELLQLQERIPGFMTLTQQALGLTGAELSKALEQGLVSADEFLPKIARQLQVTFGGAAVEASKNAQSAIFNLQNQYLQFKEAIGGNAAIAGVGANALSAVLGVATQEVEGLNASLNKGFSILAAIGSAVGSVLASLGKVAGVGKSIEVILSAISAVLTALVGSVAVNLIKQVLAIPKIADLMGGGLKALRESLRAALATLGELLVKFLVLQLAVETTSAALSVMIPTEIGQQFKRFADYGVDNLQRIQDAAKKAREEMQSIPSGAPSNERGSAGPDIGNALTLGALSYTTDDLIKGYNTLEHRFLQGVHQTPFGGLFNDPNQVEPLRTIGDVRAEKTILAQDQMSDVTRSLVGQATSGQLQLGQGQTLGIEATLQNVGALDRQLTDLQNQRALVASTPKPDQGKLRDIDEQIKTLTAQKDQASDPYIQLQSSLQTQLDNAKKALESGIDADKTLSPQDKTALKLKVKADITQLEKAQDALGKFNAQIKTSISAGRELSDAFLKVAAALEEARRHAERGFNQRGIAIADRKTKRFQEDPFAEQKSAAEQAVSQQQLLDEQVSAGREALDKNLKDLQSPSAQAILAGIPVGNSGKPVTIESTLEEIELAKSKLAPAEKEGNKGMVLDRLKEYRQAADKQLELEKQAAEARTSIQQAQQTESLANLERNSAIAEAETKRAENNKLAVLRDRQRTQKLEDSEVAVEQARLGLASVRDSEKNAKAQLEALKTAHAEGLMSAAEFDRRERDLVNALSDLKARKAEQELALQEAINRQVLEGLELANRKADASILMAQTLAITVIKRKILKGEDRETAAIEQTGVDESAAQQRANLLWKELEQTKQLRQDKRITQKEATEKELELNQKLAETNGQLVDLQLQKQHQLRERAIKDIEDVISAEERKGRLEIANLDAVKTRMIEIAQKALELQERLIQAKGELQKSLDQLATTRLEIQVKESDEALKLKELLKDPKAGPETKRVARKQLQALGFSGSDSLSQLNDQKLEREQALARQKQAALVREEALQQRLLEFEIKKQEFAAKANQLEARKNLLLQQQAMTQAKLKLEKAEAMEPGRERDRALAEAQAELKLATEGFGLAKDQLQMADSQAAAQGEYSQAQRDKMTADQQNERVTFQEGQRERLRGAEVESAQLADKTHRRSQFDFEGAMSEFNRMPVPLPIGMDMSLHRPVQPGAFQTAPSLNPIQSIQQFQPSNARASGFMETLVTMLSQKLDQLNANIERLANTPRSIAFHSQQPVEDYADYQNRQATNLMRAWS